jgi:hypothetical protein
MVWLVIEREFELREIDELGVELAVSFRKGVEPGCDGGADAARAGAGDDRL